MKIIAVTSKFLPSNLKNYCKERGVSTIRLNQDLKSIEPKWMLIYRLFTDSFKCLKHLKALRRADTILSVSYLTIPLLVYRKIGLLDKRTSFVWEGFFLHNPKSFPIFKKIIHFLFKEGDSLIVYSQFERELYATSFDLQRSDIHYVPLVFDPEPGQAIQSEYTKRADFENLPEDFYFSGGYSHRDYATLIDVFKTMDATLVICSSRLNNELDNLDIPKNVILLNDVSRDDFAELIKRSKACLLLIKSDSGAAGQLFAMEAMYYEKIIIASSTSILQEFISHKENGFIVRHAAVDIPAIIREIEHTSADFDFMRKNAKQKILDNNSKLNYDVHLDAALKTGARIPEII